MNELWRGTFECILSGNSIFTYVLPVNIDTPSKQDNCCVTFLSLLCIYFNEWCEWIFFLSEFYPHHFSERYSNICSVWLESFYVINDNTHVNCEFNQIKHFFHRMSPPNCLDNHVIIIHFFLFIRDISTNKPQN